MTRILDFSTVFEISCQSCSIKTYRMQTQRSRTKGQGEQNTDVYRDSHGFRFRPIRCGPLLTAQRQHAPAPMLTHYACLPKWIDMLLLLLLQHENLRYYCYALFITVIIVVMFLLYFVHFNKLTCSQMYLDSRFWRQQRWQTFRVQRYGDFRRKSRNALNA